VADITHCIPKETETVKRIYDHYKREGDSERPRGYLGASIIGHPCERYLWYTFRFCCRPEFDGRMYRLFETGDLEEIRFVKDLRAIGCTVHEVDDTGHQFAISDHGGHFSGHLDGALLGVPEAPKTWHVGEFKTHSAKSFAKLKVEGVKKSKPQHYAQMMVYMHKTGMKRALYLARNKDTDELYSERIRYDKDEAEALMARAQRIITSTTPPAKLSDRPDWWECRYCDARNLCHGNHDGPALPVPEINCRQCCHATPCMDGQARWQCEKHGRSLSPEDQSRACWDHLCLPGLISFAEPTDYKSEDGKDAIEFTCANGSKFLHGRGHYSTQELTKLPARTLLNPMVAAVKQGLGATVTSYCADDILHRYPESDSRIIWKGPAAKLGSTWLGEYGEELSDIAPIARCDCEEYAAAEFINSRVAIFWKNRPVGSDNCEIREGIS